MNNKEPKKLYYSISELSQILDEEQYVLRYWEREFDEIKPRKNRAGNRAYTASDIALIQLIKKLLREERLTIQKTKDKLKTLDLNSIVGYQPEPIVQEASRIESIQKVAAKPRNPEKRVKAIDTMDGLLQNIESSAAKPLTKKSGMVSLRRQDVLELCKLLKDMATLIQYM
ncbi:MAG: MerR family transcriptional regulator [Ignavibacteriae bacterium]|nr:MerR family transcriptional regulator [Ignavibacteriota bacterium]